MKPHPLHISGYTQRTRSRCGRSCEDLETRRKTATISDGGDNGRGMNQLYERGEAARPQAARKYVAVCRVSVLLVYPMARR